MEDMTLEQVIKRLTDLDIEVRDAKEVKDVEALTEEKKDLLERKVELESLEKRKADTLAISVGTVQPQIIERNGENKMEKRTFAVDTAEYRDAFLLNLQGKELDVEQRTAVTGSAAIPTMTWNKIVEKAEKIAPIISKVTLTNIAGNISIPVEDSTADASWVAMGTASTDSADGITSVSLSAYKLIKTVEIGADVQAMAIAEFERYIVDKLSKKIAKAVENAILNGTGSAQPTGLAYGSTITNTGTFTKVGMTYADLLAIVADLPDAGYRDNACFVMPSALFYSDVLPALTDKGSGLDVQAVEKLKVLNYDIILCDRLAADTIIFGDFSYYHFNWAMAPAIQADGSVGFRTGSTVYRAMGLADGKPTNIAAFNKYTRALA